ncbi:hypothetical protein [Streptomyces sp. NBC_01304]|uniref:hypothetical protein n=1 Tax=Streptomyces sp. NBC_01304 TaxID=2903818 RepID=UPI002E1379B1|nr:hypothetical protein OG430_19915 [Streptomyces sp. NBC_01304]
MPVAGLLGLLLYVDGGGGDDPSGPAPVRAGADAALPGGGKARLSRCGKGGMVREEAGGSLRLTVRSYGYHKLKAKDRGRFIVNATVAAEDEPLLLKSPKGSAGRIPELRGAVEVFGPHGQGRIATGEGLRVTAVGDVLGKPLKSPASGAFRIHRDRDVLVEVELPARAVCPGLTIEDLNTSKPSPSNDALDHPVLTLILSGPEIGAYRQRTAEDRYGDRLVAAPNSPADTHV